jgi:hypothetical protein
MMPQRRREGNESQQLVASGVSSPNHATCKRRAIRRRRAIFTGALFRHLIWPQGHRGVAPIASKGPGLAAKHADRFWPVFQTTHRTERDGTGIADHGARA